MWIRSQNRMQLQDVNRFVIEQFETGIYIVGNGCTLGEYSTVDKALKVLNEIRNELNDAQYYEIENNGNGMYTLNTGIRVYTMPQDEDVEV